MRLMLKIIGILGLGLGAFLMFSDKSPAEIPPAPPPLNKAIVSITFDDATMTQFKNAFPIAQKHNIPGTLYVQTGPIGFDEWNMTWDDVFTFRKAGWEIGGHTKSHANLMAITDTEREEELRVSTALLEDKLGELPVSFAAPYGEFDDKVIEQIRGYYENNVAAWGSEEGIDNVIGETDPYRISRYNVKKVHTGSQLCEATKRAVEKKTWIVFAFHGIVDSPSTDYEASVQTFEELLTCVSEFRDKGELEVLVVKEALMYARKRLEGGITTAELKGDKYVSQ